MHPFSFLLIPTALVLALQAAAQDESLEGALPDFSFAGYDHGESAPPDVDGRTLDVTDFGAVPDDGRDDAAAIQRAFDVAERVAPCVVYFPPGRFQLGTVDGPPIEPLTMTASDVVLRGSGHEAGGTELFLARHLDARDPEKMWTTPYALQLGPASIAQGAPARVVSAYDGPTDELLLDDVRDLAVGDWVRVAGRTPELNAAFVAPLEPEPEWTRMLEQGVQVSQRLQVAAVKGERVVLRAPLQIALTLEEPRDLELVVSEQTMGRGIGVEDLAFVGNWTRPFRHHRSDVDDGGWSLLQLRNVTDSWIRRCRFTDVNRPWVLSRCANVSVLDAYTDGNRGHHASGLSEATHCLVAWYADRAGHHHGPGVQARAAGNVFHAVTWPASTSFEAHANYPMLTLFDACRGALRYGHWGGDRRGLPNHLGGLVFWNFEQVGAPVRDFEFWRPRSRGVHGRVVPPVIVGWFGPAEAESSLAEGQARALLSKGAAVEPASLWKLQLAERLGGELPKWLTER